MEGLGLGFVEVEHEEERVELEGLQVRRGGKGHFQSRAGGLSIDAGTADKENEQHNHNESQVPQN